MGILYGWRAKIGVLYPFLHGIPPTWPDDYKRVTPEGVEWIDSKLVFPVKAEPGVRDDKEAFPVMLQHVEAAAKEVLLQDPDVIIQMGGALSIFRGWGADNDIVTKIESVTGKPAATHGQAEVEALKSLGINRVVVVTPYADAVNEALKNYFGGAGLDVVLLKRLGTVRDVYATSPYGLYRPIKETFLKGPPADGVIMMCGAIRTFDIIQPLEDDIGKPVITAGQAAVWKAFKMVNVRAPVKGYGKLLETM